MATAGQRIKLAALETSKLNLGSAVKALTAPQLVVDAMISPQSYRGLDDKGFWMFNLEGKGCDNYFEYTNSSSAISAYTKCPPVSAILQQKATAYINGQTWVMGKDGKESKTAAAGFIRSLFANPNPLQTGAQFEMQVYINTMLFGYTCILPIRPAGFPNYTATQLWAMPGNMVAIEESDEFYFSYKRNDDGTPVDLSRIKSITLTYKGIKTPLNLSDVFIIRDITPSLNSVILPQARIASLSQPVNNIIGALESRGVLISNRGPRFVVSNGSKDNVSTIPMTPDEKDEVQAQFKARYGMLQSQSQAIISSAAIQVQTIGFDVKELGLMEEVQESSSMLCLGFGFPKFLAGLSDPTFNNQDAAEKALYQRFLIPESKNFYDQWNKMFDTTALGLTIEKDYSDISVLQEDRLNLGKARYYMNQACLIEFQNNLLTLNEWRIANNLDILADIKGNAITDGDFYYYQLLSAGWQFGAGKLAPAGNAVDENGNLITSQ